LPRFPILQFRRFGLSLALLCASLAAAQSAPAGSAGQATYTVRPGDTAYSVARLAGTDVPTLLRVNGLTGSDLHAGQLLRLPGNAATVPSPAPVPAEPVASPPRSHTVQPGQTLYSVARLYGLKPDELQAFNHLSSPDLKSGQRLLLPGSAPVPFGPPAPVSVAAIPVTPVPAPPAAVPASSLPRHTVTPGQTLYAIARLYSLKAADLLALNRLSGGDLRAGQVLLLPAGTVALPPASAGTLPFTRPPASAVPAGTLLTPGVPLPAAPAQPEAPRGDLPLPGLTGPDASDPTTGPVAGPVTGPVQDWRGVAMSLLGVPYLYGGQTRGGTDCSGLVLQVFGPLGLKLPRQSALQAQTGTLVQPDDLQAGDLLFFDTEGHGTVTHVGIYLGDYQGKPDAFINANSYNGQVAVNQLSDRYFAQRYLWARRVLGVLAQGR